MIADCTTTPRASLFSEATIQKIANADKKILGADRVSFGHLPVCFLCIYFCYSIFLGFFLTGYVLLSGLMLFLLSLFE